MLLQCLTQCPRLEELSFENNYLKPEMVPPLVKAVRRMVSLTSLNLANNNNLGFSAAKLLLQVHFLCVRTPGWPCPTTSRWFALGQPLRTRAHGMHFHTGCERSCMKQKQATVPHPSSSWPCHLASTPPPPLPLRVSGWF